MLKKKVSKIKLELSNHYVPEKAILNTVVDGMCTEDQFSKYIDLL